MDWISDPQIWISLVTLTVLEVVLGIDNIVFVSILASKLPPDQQARARRVGLILALVTRVLLLCGLAFMARLTKPLFEVFHHPVSGRDIVLILGGLFLLGKATFEIHEKLEGEDGEGNKQVTPKFANIIVQIMLLDIVFSLDSVITAVGMVKQIGVMIAAVVIAMVFMLIFVNRVSAFIDKHPTIKMLALSFLILIGCMLVAEGFHKEIPKGYVYFAMAFAVGVEMLNLKVRRAKATPPQPVELHQKYR
jgi:predicted tellurium resistance membrane protein TerC